MVSKSELGSNIHTGSLAQEEFLKSREVELRQQRDSYIIDQYRLYKERRAGKEARIISDRLRSIDISLRTVPGVPPAETNQVKTGVK